MEGMEYQPENLVASSLAPVVQVIPPPDRGFSKKHWDEVKETIRELYLDQGYTLQKLAGYLQENHGFKPSKKQLTYRISSWGFEKNVKKQERKDIIKQLGSKVHNPDFAPQNHKGRQINKAKLNRWIRKENISTEKEKSSITIVDFEFGLSTKDWTEVSSMLSHGLDKTSEDLALIETSTNKKQVHFDEFIEELEIARPAEPQRYGFDPNYIDIVGSPRLTRLFGYLTIMECEDIPDLDLNENNSAAGDIWSQNLLDICCQSDRHGEEDISGDELMPLNLGATDTIQPNVTKTSRIYIILEIFTKKWFQYELYPFPTSQTSSRSTYDFTMYFPRDGSKPRMSKSHCRKKFRVLQQLKVAEIIDLIEETGAIAVGLYEATHYAEAEIWFRRVVTIQQIKGLISWYKPQQTLWACTRIVSCMKYRGRYKDAHQIQQDFHKKVERLLGVDHDITSVSRQLNIFLSAQLGLKEEKERLLRQHIQICIATLGLAHARTIEALEDLGYTLASAEKYMESQHLLITTMHLNLRKTENTREVWRIQWHILRTVSYLAETLNLDSKYGESEEALDWAQKLLGDVTRSRFGIAFFYHSIRASTYRLQKRFAESEKIALSLLKYHRISIPNNLKINIMWDLTMILMDTERGPEAAYWLSEVYILGMEACKLVHPYTMASCHDAGFCYANQGQYNKASSFFANAIKALTSSTEDVNDRMNCIRKINAWLLRVEDIRAKHSGPRESVAEKVDLDFGSDIYWRRYGDLPDLCPLPRLQG